MNFFDKFKDTLVQRFDVQIRLMKLNLISGASSVLGYTIFFILVIFSGLTMLLFAGIGLAELLAELIGTRFWGYFATSGIFFIIVLLLIMARKSFGNMFSGIFVRLFSEGKDDEEDE